MIKKIALVLVLCVVAAMLCGCSTSYEEANINNRDDFSAGYFTTIKQWAEVLIIPLKELFMPMTLV